MAAILRSKTERPWCRMASSVQSEGVATPRRVLPRAEIAQQLRTARLSNQRKIIKSEFLKAASKSPAFLHLACNEKTPRGGREACKLHIAFFRIVRAGGEHVDGPDSGLRMKQPEFAPALERLHCEHEGGALENRLRRGHPYDPVSAAAGERHGASRMRFGKFEARLAWISRCRAEQQRFCPGCRCTEGPADSADAQHRVFVLDAAILAEIVRVHGEKLGVRSLGRHAGRIAAPCLLIGNRCQNPGAPGMKPALGYCAQVPRVDLVEQFAAFTVERGAQHRTQFRVDAVRPRQAEYGVRSLLGTRASLRQHAAEHFTVVAHLHSTAAFETAHVNAELLHRLKVRAGLSGTRTIARGRIRQPF